MHSAPLRVLIVDDSALMRRMLGDMLASDPDLDVIGYAEDPFVAREKIKQLNPDVLTLDVEMPRMHGLDFLEKIMTLRPMPVVMISSLTTEGAEVTIRALELGAVDFVAKPTNLQHGLSEQRAEIVAKVKMAGRARVRSLRRSEPTPPHEGLAGRLNGKIVAIGASTGGVEALGQVLGALPKQSPPILISQHMPERFVPCFANRLNAACQVTISVARDGEPVEAGHVYVAPGNIHLQLAKSAQGFCCRLRGDERVSGHCPSVDVLFQSVAKHAGPNAIGLILTGMGADGARGMASMKAMGAYTIGQDEASSLVYGMPRVAFEQGAVDEQLPLSRIAARVLKLCSREEVRS